MPDKIDKEKEAELSSIQAAINKKVETFMGAPPEEKIPAKEAGPGETVKPEPTPEPPKKDLPSAPLLDDKPEPDLPKEEAEKSEDKPTEEPKTDEAIDDIVAKESDAVLAAEDEVAKAFEPKKEGLKEKLKDFFAGWWANKRARWITISTVLVVLVSLMVVPTTRYFILNTASVRSSSSLMVLDESTQQPLKNVEVKIAGQSGMTDNEGKVQLRHLKLGATELVIQKRAFAPITRKITVGWGSNPLGSFALQAIGSQFAFSVKDWLSGKPIGKAEAISNEASAFSDEEGKIVLTVDTTDDKDLPITIKAEGYRDEVFDLPVTSKGSREVAMVAARKEVFVSKRSGKYDVYKIDVDGKNEEVVLKGTGREREDIALAPHPTDEQVALVSSRDNVRNADGYLLSTLTLIDLQNNATTSLGQSEQIELVGWIGSRLIYVQVAAGASAANPKRNRLISYDYKTGDKKELAATNYFNDVMVAGDSIYYAPSSNYQNQAGIYLYKISADGANSQTIIHKQTWNIFRTQYDELAISAEDEWHSYKLGGSSTTKLNGQPSNLNNRVYIDSPDKKQSLWIDTRDGKGVLLAYDTAAKSDKTLKTQSGLVYPVRWLNSTTIIYRIQTPGETADYVISTEGGEAKKIKDVTHTTGLDTWYYY